MIGRGPEWDAMMADAAPGAVEPTAGHYVTDPGDPEAPVLIDEHEGMKPGDLVEYADPKLAFGLTGPMTLVALYRFSAPPGLPDGAMTQAILKIGGEDSEYEVNADNLRRVAQP